MLSPGIRCRGVGAALRLLHLTPSSSGVGDGWLGVTAQVPAHPFFGCDAFSPPSQCTGRGDLAAQSAEFNREVSKPTPASARAPSRPARPRSTWSSVRHRGARGCPTAPRAQAERFNNSVFPKNCCQMFVCRAYSRRQSGGRLFREPRARFPSFLRHSSRKRRGEDRHQTPPPLWRELQEPHGSWSWGKHQREEAPGCIWDALRSHCSPLTPLACCPSSFLAQSPEQPEVPPATQGNVHSLSTPSSNYKSHRTCI